MDCVTCLRCRVVVLVPTLTEELVFLAEVFEDARIARRQVRDRIVLVEVADQPVAEELVRGARVRESR